VQGGNLRAYQIAPLAMRMGQIDELAKKQVGKLSLADALRERRSG